MPHDHIQRTGAPRGGGGTPSAALRRRRSPQATDRLIEVGTESRSRFGPSEVRPQHPLRRAVGILPAVRFLLGRNPEEGPGHGLGSSVAGFPVCAEKRSLEQPVLNGNGVLRFETGGGSAVRVSDCPAGRRSEQRRRAGKSVLSCCREQGTWEQPKRDRSPKARAKRKNGSRAEAPEPCCRFRQGRSRLSARR